MHIYRHFTSAAVALGLALGVGSAHAWTADGHETVGKLGAALIAGVNAEAEVQRLLGMSLERAAVWADCAKGVRYVSKTRTFVYQSAGKFPECQPFEDEPGRREMEAFVARNSKNCDVQPGDEECHRQYHYTDVALQRDQYVQGLVGTSDHDVVAAVKAAILVLQGYTPPAPFRFSSKREALLVLVHYVGDIHQPLHVASVYLDRHGAVVDPDQGSFNPATKTIGGNSIEDGQENFHREWDTVPDDLKAAGLGSSGVQEARQIDMTPGDPLSWPAQWATDTLVSSRPVFANTTFGEGDIHSKHWDINTPANYAATRESIQRAQLLKAGARLAQLLTAIWP